MSATDTTSPSHARRQAMALAAALTATVLAAIAAVGGLTRLSAQPTAPVAKAPVVSVVHQAPPAQTTYVDDREESE